jgi:hypothetical protein
VETISRVELIQQLTLTPKQFDAAVKAAGLQPQNAYSQDDAELIRVAVASGVSSGKGGQMTRKTKEQSRSELSQSKAEMATQAAQAGYQEGSNLAKVATEGLMKGYRDEMTANIQTLTAGLQASRVTLAGDQALDWVYESVDGADFLSLAPEDLVL